VNEIRRPDSDNDREGTREELERLRELHADEFAYEEEYSLLGWPAGALLRTYHSLDPSYADMVLSQMKAEMEHRHSLEDSQQSFMQTHIAKNREGATEGRRLAFVLCMTVVILSFVAIFLGHDGPGVAGVCSALGVLVAAFITDKVTESIADRRADDEDAAKGSEQ